MEEKIMQAVAVLLLVALVFLVRWLYKKNQLRKKAEEETQSDLYIASRAETLENQVILGQRIQEAKAAGIKLLYFRILTPMNQDRASEIAWRFKGCRITILEPIKPAQAIRVNIF